MILSTFGRFGRFSNFDKLYEKKSDLADFFFYKNYISHRDAIDQKNERRPRDRRSKDLRSRGRRDRFLHIGTGRFDSGEKEIRAESRM